MAKLFAASFMIPSIANLMWKEKIKRIPGFSVVIDSSALLPTAILSDHFPFRNCPSALRESATLKALSGNVERF
jgi:hypothetical protein